MEAQKLPDGFFDVESPIYLSYRFVDMAGLPISNEFGYRVIKYIKTTCVQHGRASIPHDDVKVLLSQYSQYELAAILVANDDAWVPPVKKVPKRQDES